MKNSLVEKVYKIVEARLIAEQTGHGLLHVERVRRMGRRFAEACGVDSTAVEIAALLHDLDDYKLVGKERAKLLANARSVLEEAQLDTELSERAISAIEPLGFSKRLQGIPLDTIDAQILSDADLCDAVGTVAAMRTFQYGLKHGRSFLSGDEKIEELIDPEAYLREGSDSGVYHLCQKCLIVPRYVVTEAGKREAITRFESLANFLNAYLRENFRDDMAAELESLVSKLRLEWAQQEK